MNRGETKRSALNMVWTCVQETFRCASTGCIKQITINSTNKEAENLKTFERNYKKTKTRAVYQQNAMANYDPYS